jgi:hypothetical protein
MYSEFFAPAVFFPDRGNQMRNRKWRAQGIIRASGGPIFQITPAGSLRHTRVAS